MDLNLGAYVPILGSSTPSSPPPPHGKIPVSSKAIMTSEHRRRYDMCWLI